jgi:xanthine dehydrogenase YagS FAD-binding subunit
MIARFEWSNAASVPEALGLLDGDAMIKAGGIDLMDRLKEGLDAPSRLVNIRTIPGLDRITESADGLHLGPMVTLARLEEHPVVRARYRALAQAAGHAATPQIRNVATVGGNLLQRPRCWYFRHEQFHCLKKGGRRCYAQEGENEYHAIFANRICAIVHPSAAATALLALSASLEITGKQGRRTVAIQDFFVRPDQDITREHSLGPGEMLTGIHVPAPGSGASSAYSKLGEKESFDWPLAEVAVSLTREAGNVQRGSVVLGAAAPVPWASPAAAGALAGRPVTEKTAQAAARAALQGATPLSGNAYKLPIFETVIRRTILEAARG